jgi:hypothetical protein
MVSYVILCCLKCMIVAGGKEGSTMLLTCVRILRGGGYAFKIVIAHLISRSSNESAALIHI